MELAAKIVIEPIILKTQCQCEGCLHSRAVENEVRELELQRVAHLIQEALNSRDKALKLAREALEAIPAGKLRLLAAYLDFQDLNKTGASNEVQQDLRRMADLSEAALQKAGGS